MILSILKQARVFGDRPMEECVRQVTLSHDPSGLPFKTIRRTSIRRTRPSRTNYLTHIVIHLTLGFAWQQTLS